MTYCAEYQEGPQRRELYQHKMVTIFRYTPPVLSFKCDADEDGGGVHPYGTTLFVNFGSSTGRTLGIIGDMDWSEGILTIRGAKFGKSRLVPLHASTRKVLADYAKRRDCRFGARGEGHFLVNKNCNRLDKGEVHRAFYILSRQIGLRAVDASRGPRLHDFRHRFAVQTLLRWYRSGEDPKQ